MTTMMLKDAAGRLAGIARLALSLVLGLALARAAETAGETARAPLPAPTAAQPAASDSLLERIAAAHQPLTTVQGRFTQRTTRIDEAAGGERAPDERLDARFFIAFPDRYCVLYTQPGDPEWRHSFLSDGSERWEIQAFSADDPPDIKRSAVGRDDAELRRLVACFRFDLAVLRQDFTMTATALTADTHPPVRVAFAPARPEIAEQVAAMAIELDSELRIVALSVDDPQGNRYAVQITEAIYDQPIDAAVFRPAQGR